MTRYGYMQYPTGWWQDRKGRMQPPGSFLDRSLRITPESSAEPARPSPMARARRLLALLGRDS